MAKIRLLQHHYTFTALLLSLVAAPVAANYIDDMSVAYTSGDSESTYTLAKQHLFEGEGDPRFDLFYGLAAIDSGSTSEGVFALERVLTAQPNNHQARLGLVRGYYDLEQYGRSRQELQTLLDSSPPDDIRKQAERYEDITNRRAAGSLASGGFYAEFGVGFDNNINGGASDRGVYVPIGGGFTTTLRDSAMAEDSTYMNAAVGVYGTVPLTSRVALFGSVDASKRDNTESSRHDIFETNVEGGVTFNSGLNEFRLTALWQDYQLGNDPYRKMAGGRAEWRRSLADGARVTLFVERDRLDYDSNSRALDSRLTLGGVSWLQPLSSDGRSIFFASLYGGNEQERENPPATPLFGQTVPDRDLYGLKLGTELAAGPDYTVDVTLQAMRSDYNERDPLFLRKRDDDYYSLAVGANWYFHQQWSLRGEVSYADNDSNIEIYSYDRAAVGVTLRFDY